MLTSCRNELKFDTRNMTPGPLWMPYSGPLAGAIRVAANPTHRGRRSAPRWPNGIPAATTEEGSKLARFRLRLSRTVSDLARPKSETKTQMVAVPPEDEAKPPEAEDLQYGCTGCLWAGMAFAGILVLTLVLNRCGRG